jgi:hypothetical protein
VANEASTAAAQCKRLTCPLPSHDHPCMHMHSSLARILGWLVAEPKKRCGCSWRPIPSVPRSAGHHSIWSVDFLLRHRTCINIFTGHSLLFCLACVIAEQGNSQSLGSTTDSRSAQNTMSQMELVSPASSAQRQDVMMVTTDDYSYKPGLAAAPPAPAAAPSFQQQQQMLHGGDHDKVPMPPPLPSFPITSTSTSTILSSLALAAPIEDLEPNTSPVSSGILLSNR